MKIGQTGAAPAIEQVGQAGTQAGERTHGGKAQRSGSSSAAGAASAEVKISSVAKDLLAGAEGGFDQAKVDRIRQSIADGTYQVNAEAIADKLIANAQDLLGRVASR